MQYLKDLSVPNRVARLNNCISITLGLSITPTPTFPIITHACFLMETRLEIIILSCRCIQKKKKKKKKKKQNRKKSATFLRVRFNDSAYLYGLG